MLFSSCFASTALSKPSPLHLNYQKPTLSLYCFSHPLQLLLFSPIIACVLPVAPLKGFGVVAFGSGGFFHQLCFHPEFLKHSGLLNVIAPIPLEHILRNIHVLFAVGESFVYIQQILLVLNPVLDQIVCGINFSQFYLFLLNVSQIFMNIGLVLGRVTTLFVIGFRNYQVTPILSKSMAVAIVELPLVAVDCFRELILCEVYLVHRILEEFIPEFITLNNFQRIGSEKLPRFKESKLYFFLD